jgi:hypothetical protein
MIDRIGNIIKANLQQWKEMTERKLNLELGNIEVKPLSHFYDEMKRYVNARRATRKENPLTRTDERKLRFLCSLTTTALGFCIGAKAGEGVIYYSRNPISYAISDENALKCLGLHEVMHIAHGQEVKRRGFDFSVLYSCDFSTGEGIADYLMMDFAGELGIKSRPIYKRNYRATISELEEKGIAGDVNASFKYLVDKSIQETQKAQEEGK